MADENAEVVQTIDRSASSSASTIKLIIAGIVVIILAAGISFGVAMFAASSVKSAEPKGDGYGKVKSETLGTTYDAGEYITNLADEGGGRFVKVRIVFAFPDAKVQEEIANKAPQIQHTINSTLREQKAENLAQPKSMEKLAEVLKKNVNALLVKGNLTNVYFTSFVVQ